MLKATRSGADHFTMPDFLKKAQKRTDAVCGPGETPQAALFIRPGAPAQASRLGTPDGRLGRIAGTDAAADKTDDGSDVSSGPFDRNSILILTDRRILVFGHGTLTGRVKDLVGELPLSDIAGMHVDSEPAALTFELVDGKSFVVTPGSRLRRFVQAFEECKSGV